MSYRILARRGLRFSWESPIVDVNWPKIVFCNVVGQYRFGIQNFTFWIMFARGKLWNRVTCTILFFTEVCCPQSRCFKQICVCCSCSSADIVLFWICLFGVTQFYSVFCRWSCFSSKLNNPQLIINHVLYMILDLHFLSYLDTMIHPSLNPSIHLTLEY